MALSGKLRSAVVIGGQGIRARKLRTFLSMISLFLGVLAVVAVQAGSEIANRALLADIELQQGKDGSVNVSLPQHAKTVEITQEVLRGHPEVVGATGTKATIGEPGVIAINPGPVPFKYADRSQGAYEVVCESNGYCEQRRVENPAPPGQAIELQLVGLTGDIRQFRPFQVRAGQWLDFGGEPSLSPGLVLNKEAATGFAQNRVPAQMRVEGGTADATPRILGVVDDGSSTPTAYVRADELFTWLSPGAATPDPRMGGGASMTLYMWPSSQPVVQTLTARLTGAGADPSQVYSNAVDSRERIGSELDLMRWIFLGMAALVLLIGVAGILNVGLATVGERIEEFALRRAVGTPRLLLAGIVLAETLIIGLLTAAAAIGVGVVGLQLAGKVLGSRTQLLQDVAFPWQAGVAGVAAGLIAGILGGLLPAIRAARIPIATVMRA
ncbi:putative ABC transporter integral membrane protein [Actinokineospora spheciospongiae]|uniref:Putative ABC transporter integral membrane protein n=1 Tax=Actinokineospora spheciospongiae TaxID=909613 RepID=W7JEL2_9PSEU|nr:ABC transporter permease [Actinokineospora spheciospongiae]EWC64404.1 putative ABC transporter integral membrane protein [Actinokineospora spheciospongiae]